MAASRIDAPLDAGPDARARHIRAVRVGVACLGLLSLSLAGCSGGPPSIPTEPGTGSLWGRFELAPPEAVLRSTATAGGSYANPRLRGVRAVDYDRPGFAVVHAPGRPAPVSPLTLEVVATRTGVRLAPETGALTVESTLTILDRSGDATVLSIPALDLLERIPAGGSITIRPPEPGPLEVHLLGAVPSVAHLFVSEGPFAICATDGRWTLSSLAPGPATIEAWHPRFPATATAVEVVAGRMTEVPLRATLDGLDTAAKRTAAKGTAPKRTAPKRPAENETATQETAAKGDRR